MTQTLGRAAILFIAITLAVCTATKPPPAPDTGAIGPAYRQATVTGIGNDAIDVSSMRADQGVHMPAGTDPSVS